MLAVFYWSGSKHHPIHAITSNENITRVEGKVAQDGRNTTRGVGDHDTLIGIGADEFGNTLSYAGYVGTKNKSHKLVGVRLGLGCPHVTGRSDREGK